MREGDREGETMARVKRLEVWLIPGKPWLSAPAAVGLGPVPLRTAGPDGSRSGHKGSHGSKATYMYLQKKMLLL